METVMFVIKSVSLLFMCYMSVSNINKYIVRFKTYMRYENMYLALGIWWILLAIRMVFKI